MYYKCIQVQYSRYQVHSGIWIDSNWHWLSSRYRMIAWWTYTRDKLLAASSTTFRFVLPVYLRVHLRPFTRVLYQLPATSPRMSTVIRSYFCCLIRLLLMCGLYASRVKHNGMKMMTNPSRPKSSGNSGNLHEKKNHHVKMHYLFFLCYNTLRAVSMEQILLWYN